MAQLAQGGSILEYINPIFVSLYLVLIAHYSYYILSKLNLISDACLSKSA